MKCLIEYEDLARMVEAIDASMLIAPRKARVLLPAVRSLREANTREQRRAVLERRECIAAIADLDHDSPASFWSAVRAAFPELSRERILLELDLHDRQMGVKGEGV